MSIEWQRETLTSNPNPGLLWTFYVRIVQILMYILITRMCNSKCVDGHDMHNNNLLHQDFWKFASRKWAVFTKNKHKKIFLGFIPVLHIQTGSASHFFTSKTEFWGLSSYLLVAIASFCTNLLLSLLFVKSDFLVSLKSFFLPQSKLLNLLMTTLTGCHCCVAVRLSYFCSLTELFTMNKHAMYYTDILYPVAVDDETPLFDTLKEDNTQKRNISVGVLFSRNCSRRVVSHQAEKKFCMVCHQLCWSTCHVQEFSLSLFNVHICMKNMSNREWNFSRSAWCEENGWVVPNLQSFSQ